MQRVMFSVAFVVTDAAISGVTLSQAPPWPVVAAMALASVAGLVFAARSIGDVFVPRD